MAEDSVLAASPARAGRGTDIALWVLQVVTAVGVFAAGVSTVASAAQAVDIFEQIGFGDWFRYLVGVLQLAGAAGLLLPRLCGLASLALVGMWFVAIGTHLFAIGGNAGAAAVFLALTAVIAWGRRDRTVVLLDNAGGDNR